MAAAWAILGSAVLSGGASILGGNAAAGAADSSANIQNSQYLQTRQDEAPWRIAGSNAVGQMNALLGLGGSNGGVSGGGVTAAPNAFATPLVGQLYSNQSTRGQTPTQDIAAALALGRTITPAQWAQGGYGPNGEGYYPSTQGGTATGGGAGQVGPTIDASTAQKNAFASFQTDPGYQFAFDQGAKALENRGSAHNGVMNGAQDKALIQFGQGTADQQYGEYFNRLQSLAGLGQSGTGTTASAGATAAGQSGGAIQAGGSALASGYSGAANAFNQGAKNYLTYSPPNAFATYNNGAWTPGPDGFPNNG